MKLLVFFLGVVVFDSAKSQSGMAIIRKADTVIYHSEILRNNLSGQLIIKKTDLGAVYLLEQDGMPCFAPEKADAAIIPNTLMPKYPFNLVQPMPVIPQKKGLPKFVPKKSGRF